VKTAAARYPVAVGAAVLTVAYLWYYMSAQALPGNSGAFPQGWWGWFDQGKTLESAQALAGRDLSPGRHWYPLGYALLGAPFLGMGFRGHPFVFVDLACLLIAFLGFVSFARACGVGRATAALLFVAAVLWDRQVFGEWAIPWNSTPAAALVWTILALCGRWLEGARRPVLVGVLAGAVPFFRPTEAVPVAACLLVVLAADWRAGALRPRHLLGLAAGGALAVAPQVGLHLLVYGPQPSDYMRVSRELGFTLHDLGWKAYVVLVDPYQWFTDGQGLLRRLPWVALALAGLAPALARGRAAAALAAALAAHLLLYVSYIDLLPTGLWRFNNIHYWKWAVPGYALLAWLLVLDLVRWRRAAPSYAAAGGLAVVGLLATVRIAPRPVGPGEPAKMLEFPGPAPGFDQSNFGNFTLRDAQGPLRNVPEIRAIPVPGGMRVIALTRDIEGPVVFEPGHGFAPALVAAEPLRFGAGLVLGRPCWLAAFVCGRRPVNDLLPPPPSR